MLKTKTYLAADDITNVRHYNVSCSALLNSDRSDKMINFNIIEIIKQTAEWLQFSVISDDLISV